LREKKQLYSLKEAHMTSITDGSVIIQTSAASVQSTPCWFGEVVLMSSYLRQQGILSKVSEQVRFTRKRFGRHEVIDFLAVLAGLREETASAPMAGVLREPPTVRRSVHGPV
jgi:hypothetical protein